MAGEEERSGIGGAVAFVGRILALLTAQEAVERFVCEEYERSIRYIRSMLVPDCGAVAPRPLPPSSIVLHQQELEKRMMKSGASSKVKQPIRGVAIKKKPLDRKVGYNSAIALKHPVSPDSTSLSCSSIEFSPAFESLLRWSKEQDGNRAKDAAATCLIALKGGRLSRQRISQGEKRFLAQLGRLENGTPSYQIQDMQMHLGKLIQTCKSKTVGFLLRIAPEPRVSKHRDTCMIALLRECSREGTSLVDLKGRRILNDRPHSYDKLWLYKIPGVAKILERNLTPLNIGTGGIVYNDPKQLSRVLVLIQRLEMVLIRWYLEAGVGEFIEKATRSKFDLRHCTLAHTLLCKEGRRSLVIAQRD
ncbi:uncharacterized protein LOC9635220 [Selaginella moellendorffii]|uniref:uncharacterized protein LOC9635220 n=1 Tax=Selaginella moellendorffii TaxID=88036 RepID=UPI000D1C2E25|nr:uncharacterized protein LOC9635220 [Selaginella moellendorffii]|eukprot:XP_024542966.1 uncharacterized protein LOC9635220 [Selaginella moellendorffii]